MLGELKSASSDGAAEIGEAPWRIMRAFSNAAFRATAERYTPATTGGGRPAFFMNAASRADAHEILEKSPLGVAGMMEFVPIALGPMAPLAMLIGEPPRT